MPGRELPINERRLLQDFLEGKAAAHRQVAVWAQPVIASPRFGIPRDEHEDILQETLRSLFVTASRLDFVLGSNLPAFVRKIAAARCVDWLRWMGRERTRNEKLKSENTPARSEEDPDWMKRDEGRRAWRAVQKLDPQCRTLIRRRLANHLSYEEISRMTDVNVHTLRSRFFQCIKKLRRLLLADFPNS